MENRPAEEHLELLCELAERLEFDKQRSHLLSPQLSTVMESASFEQRLRLLKSMQFAQEEWAVKLRPPGEEGAWLLVVLNELRMEQDKLNFLSEHLAWATGWSTEQKQRALELFVFESNRSAAAHLLKQ